MGLGNLIGKVIELGTRVGSSASKNIVSGSKKTANISKAVGRAAGSRYEKEIKVLKGWKPLQAAKDKWIHGPKVDLFSNSRVRDRQLGRNLKPKVTPKATPKPTSANQPPPDRSRQITPSPYAQSLNAPLSPKGELLNKTARLKGPPRHSYRDSKTGRYAVDPKKRELPREKKKKLTRAERGREQSRIDKDKNRQREVIEKDKNRQEEIRRDSNARQYEEAQQERARRQQQQETAKPFKKKKAEQPPKPTKLEAILGPLGRHPKRVRAAAIVGAGIYGYASTEGSTYQKVEGAVGYATFAGLATGKRATNLFKGIKKDYMRVAEGRPTPRKVLKKGSNQPGSPTISYELKRMSHEKRNPVAGGHFAATYSTVKRTAKKAYKHAINKENKGSMFKKGLAAGAILGAMDEDRTFVGGAIVGGTTGLAVPAYARHIQNLPRKVVTKVKPLGPELPQHLRGPIKKRKGDPKVRGRRNKEVEASRLSQRREAELKDFRENPPLSPNSTRIAYEKVDLGRDYRKMSYLATGAMVGGAYGAYQGGPLGMMAGATVGMTGGAISKGGMEAWLAVGGVAGMGAIVGGAAAEAYSAEQQQQQSRRDYSLGATGDLTLGLHSLRHG
jgi:hypothetical protein